jgi:hypothetical protein
MTAVAERQDFDLKEEEAKRNHFSSSATKRQNARWKQESSLY